MRTEGQEVLDFLTHRPVGRPETSVDNYHSSLRDNSEERRSHLHRGERLIPGTLQFGTCMLVE